MRKSEGKVKTLEEMKLIIQDAKKSGLVIVTTNGAFDLLHAGHARYLEEAKACGDKLVVAVNTDGSVRRNKGEKRPVVPCEERMELLAALECVDYVFPFAGDTPVEWIEVLKPDVHVKGGDYSGNVVEKAAVEKNGGKVVFAGKTEGMSTTAVIEKILSLYS